MEVMHARCAGLDVHKKLIVACVRVWEGGSQRSEVQEFGATTNELVRLGLIDLVLEHPDGLDHIGLLRRQLQADDHLELHKYVVTAYAASRRPELVAMLLDAASVEQDVDRLLCLSEALELLPGSDEVDQAMGAVSQRLRAIIVSPGSACRGQDCAQSPQ